jgi:hypothetical protein
LKWFQPFQSKLSHWDYLFIATVLPGLFFPLHSIFNGPRENFTLTTLFTRSGRRVRRCYPMQNSIASAAPEPRAALVRRSLETFPVFESWILEFVWFLVFGVRCFRRKPIPGEAKHYLPAGR